MITFTFYYMKYNSEFCHLGNKNITIIFQSQQNTTFSLIFHIFMNTGTNVFKYFPISILI